MLTFSIADSRHTQSQQEWLNCHSLVKQGITINVTWFKEAMRRQIHAEKKSGIHFLQIGLFLEQKDIKSYDK